MLLHPVLVVRRRLPSSLFPYPTLFRSANALSWLTRGYALGVNEVVGDAVFAEAHESMVMVRDIELYSMCEHHLLRSEEHTSELQSQSKLVCRLPLEKKNQSNR